MAIYHNKAVRYFVLALATLPLILGANIGLKRGGLELKMNSAIAGEKVAKKGGRKSYPVPDLSGATEHKTLNLTGTEGEKYRGTLFTNVSLDGKIVNVLVYKGMNSEKPFAYRVDANNNEVFYDDGDFGIYDADGDGVFEGRVNGKSGEPVPKWASL